MNLPTFSTLSLTRSARNAFTAISCDISSASWMLLHLLRANPNIGLRYLVIIFSAFCLFTCLHLVESFHLYRHGNLKRLEVFEKFESICSMIKLFRAYLSTLPSETKISKSAQSKYFLGVFHQKD